MLKVENVKKAFGDVTVLDGVNLTVQPGEVVSILGSSGSGKSTLIRCINGLEKLNGGRITVDEFDVSRAKELTEARKRSASMCQTALPAFRPFTCRRKLCAPVFSSRRRMRYATALMKWRSSATGA